MRCAYHTLHILLQSSGSGGQSALQPINPAYSRNPKPPALAGGEFTLDAEKFRQFNKLLDARPARNPGLERLMAVKPPWD